MQLKRIRTATGLSRERFANLIGASLASINRWESPKDLSFPSGAVLRSYELLKAAKRNGADLIELANIAETKSAAEFMFRLAKAALKGQ